MSAVDVTQLHNDVDSVNTDLTYLISAGVAEDKFTVNFTTGVVSTTQRLDRDTRDSWIITGDVYSTCLART